MVEIRNYSKKLGTSLLALLLVIGTGGAHPAAKSLSQGSLTPTFHADSTAQAPETEEQRHKRLMQQMQSLRKEGDSIRTSVLSLREEVTTHPERMQELAQKIIPLESRLIALHKEISVLADSITRIEQHWLATGHTPEPSQDAPSQSVASKGKKQRRNLVSNSIFREKLSSRDHQMLLKVQQRESEAFDLANRYIDNYTTISELAAVYDTIKVETEAVKLRARCNALQETNRTIGDSLKRTWSLIFDNKAFAYGYLLDLTNHSEIRRSQQTELDKASRKIAFLKDSTESEQLIEYFIHKKMLLRLEQQVAELFDLTSARDSLKAAENLLDKIDYRLPRLLIRERYFIDFEDVHVTSPSIYNYKNPIPECKVYARGTIYRIRLGVFSTKRPVSVFRGISPLGYLRNESHRWEYYAGGYATYAEAVKACDLLKSKGFRAPMIFVWNDGEKSEVSENTENAAIRFRIEISGKSQLPDDVRALIEPLLGELQFSRVSDQLYVLGMFFDKVQAEQLASELTRKDGELKIKVVEIQNNPQ